MKYCCRIVNKNIDEITIKIEGVEIVCFSNRGCISDVGCESICELSFYDEISIEATNDSLSVDRIGSTFSYKIVGILDIENEVLKSCIDFSIDKSVLFNVAYLDKQMVTVIVTRIDIDFLV